jgi:phosphoenolpyruvate synthase/pyruvate phosphate dikinase
MEHYQSIMDKLNESHRKTIAIQDKEQTIFFYKFIKEECSEEEAKLFVREIRKAETNMDYLMIKEFLDNRKIKVEILKHRGHYAVYQGTIREIKHFSKESKMMCGNNGYHDMYSDNDADEITAEYFELAKLCDKYE